MADELALIRIPALDNTFGALLLGTFVGLILYGVTLHQSYRYYRTYPCDTRLLKGLVAVVLCLDTVTSVISMHACYFYLVTNYFNPLRLLEGVWSINLFTIFSGLVMVTSQSFFARRVYLLGRKYRILVGLSAILCAVELGFFTAATAQAFILPTFADFKNVTWMVSTGSTMAVSADIILTAVLIVILRRSRTGVKRTDSMIDVMIMYSINTGEYLYFPKIHTLAECADTGFVTGVFNMLALFFAFILPGDLIYAGVGIPGVKLYANTLLAALNSRKSLASAGSLSINDTSPFGYSVHPSSGNAKRSTDAGTMTTKRAVSKGMSSACGETHELKQMATMVSLDGTSDSVLDIAPVESSQKDVTLLPV